MAARFSSLLYQAEAIVLEAGKLVEQASANPQHIQHKGRVDLVTQTDTTVEAFLIDHLSVLLPGSHFLAEESATGQKVPGEPCWIIDPVDGTTNFAHTLPIHAISVALWADGGVQAALIHAPLLHETFLAEKGRGATFNGSSMRVSSTQSCEEALVATGFPYSIQEDVDLVLARLRKALVACQGIRRCGAASLDMAWVACGRFDGYFEAGVKAWDVAAGCLLVEEAGGTVSAINGNPYVFGDPILATNGHIHKELGQVLKG